MRGEAPPRTRSAPSTARHPTSLMPERLDRIEPRRAARREIAEDHADGCGEGEGKHVDAEVEDIGHLHDAGQENRRRRGNGDADQAAQAR